jgi:HSP20 family protein
MTLMRFSPFSDLVDFGISAPIRANGHTAPQTRFWNPPVDVIETEQHVKLMADLPGVQPDQVEIKIENGLLTLSGARHWEKPENASRLERSYGRFVRTFSLPDSVNSDETKADFKHGVLTITIPKKEAAKPKTIKIQVEN